MVDIDVDEILEVDYRDASSVQITFKNGTTKIYGGPELPEVLGILNHWTPPTA